MWVRDASLHTLSFYTLYSHHIKSALGDKYYPYKAYFKGDIPYDLIEKEINNLIKAYTNASPYRPTLALYSHNKELSIHIPILLRLNAIAYAIKYIPKAYYQFKIGPIHYIKPKKTTFKHPTSIKLFCILLVVFIACILRYNRLKYYIYYCLFLLGVLMVLWKL
jgi:hypothetical protein